LTFTLGEGTLLKGFEAAIDGMTAGDTTDITLTEDDAYGARDPERTTSIERSVFPDDLNLDTGETVPLMAPNGQPVMATVMEATDKEVTFDVNHPLAGKTINFSIELLDINTTN
jgi:peptidylprolyl isomerase